MSIGGPLPSAQTFSVQRIESQPGPAALDVPAQSAAAVMAPLGATLAPPARNAADPACAATADQVRQRALSGPAPGAAQTSPSRAGFSQARLDEAGQSVLAARQVGVDLAKSAFVKSCGTLALKGVVVGIAAALTAASFGGAAPLLGLACASMAISACDSVCAYRNFKNADAHAQGLPKPYAELRYNNSLMNLAHSVATACGMSDSNAGTAAKVTAVVVGGGLAVAAFALSLGMSGVPEVIALVSDCTSGVRAAYTVVAAGAEWYAVGGNHEAVRTQLGAAEHALGGILQGDRFMEADDLLNDPDFVAAQAKLLALMNNDAEESVTRGTSLQGTTGKAINGACMSLGLLAMVPEVAEFGSNLMQV